MKESRYNIWIEHELFAYVFNGISGALLRMPKEDYDSLRKFLSNGGKSNCSPKLLEQMAYGYMLIPDHSDELSSLASLYNASRYDRSTFGLTIVTSLGCNFDCPYCFEAKHPSIMSEDTQKAVLAVLDDQLSKGIKNFYVTWFGGEPLVGKKPLLSLSDAFIERCQQKSVEYAATIVTNGYLLDEKTCIELKERKISHVQISLDGPPQVHDKMRPLVNGDGSFWQIVKNLHHAVRHLDVIIRMNIDRQNFGQAEEMLKILANEGFSGKLQVYVGQIVGVNDGIVSPSVTYKPNHCFTNKEFAQAELKFKALAKDYGFSSYTLPRPTATPCTAVRSNELVVGSTGELYKCWDSVGNPLEIIGTIYDYDKKDGRLQKWLKYDPFSNDECCNCIALPICMGGCAHHAMDKVQYENRCGTFRHNYNEEILAFIDAMEQAGYDGDLTSMAELAHKMETR